MEEEIKMMFQLGQPEGWRNSGLSFTLPIHNRPIVDNGSSTDDDNPSEDGTYSEEFWYEIGLGAFSQLEFDLELTLNSGHERNKKSESNSSGSGGVLGGYLFNRENKQQQQHQQPVVLVGDKNNGQCKSNSDKKQVFSDDELLEQGEEVMVLESGVNNSGDGQILYSSSNDVLLRPRIPPNDLYLANVLRMSIDCPFPDIRKQAANILFLLKEKGAMVPRPVFDGPSSFIPSSNWPSIDADIEDNNENIEEEQQNLGGDDDVIVEVFDDLQNLEACQHAQQSKKL